MSSERQYDATQVEVVFQDERRSTWEFAGTTAKGVEYLYVVIDHNFDRLNKWVMVVQVPPTRDKIVVQPQSVPGKKAFAGLERRSIIFGKATKHPHRSKLYCKVFLADPTGNKNRRSTSRDDRALLPIWFDYFKSTMRLKETVTTTAGTDGKHLVVLVGREDHERMIRLYFAMRVWVLQEGFVLP